jgi:hypothetical protein
MHKYLSGYRRGWPYEKGPKIFFNPRDRASKDRARSALIGGDAVSFNYFLFSAALGTPRRHRNPCGEPQMEN